MRKSFHNYEKTLCHLELNLERIEEPLCLRKESYLFFHERKKLINTKYIIKIHCLNIKLSFLKTTEQVSKMFYSEFTFDKIIGHVFFKDRY